MNDITEKIFSITSPFGSSRTRTLLHSDDREPLNKCSCTSMPNENRKGIRHGLVTTDGRAAILPSDHHGSARESHIYDYIMKNVVSHEFIEPIGPENFKG
jgi:hypothetical protein